MVITSPTGGRQKKDEETGEIMIMPKFAGAHDLRRVRHAVVEAGHAGGAETVDATPLDRDDDELLR